MKSLLLSASVLALACSHAQTVHTAFDQLTPIDVPSLRTHLTPAQVTQACDAAEKAADLQLAILVAIPDSQRTFANSFDAFEQAMSEYADAVGRLSFLKEIHPDAKVREAAGACEEAAGKYAVKVGARKDIYLALKTFRDRDGQDPELDALDKRLIELTMRDFKRSGLDLSDENREKLSQLRQRLAELGTKYSVNLDEDSTHFETTPAELEGLPADFIAAHTKDGVVTLTTKYPDYYPVMENAKHETLRKQMWLAFQSREADKNLPLLTEALSLRDQAAKLLGYPTHADFVTEDRMAKSAKTVADFLERLRGELLPARDALNKQMLVLKLSDTGNPAAQLETWDWRYYLNRIKKEQYSIDNEAVRQYFPVDKVMAGLFKVYGTLLGVTFNEVARADVWADGVKLYEVHDGVEGDGRLLAKFYIDMFPRDGKYGHAANFTFGVPRALPNGYQIPISALVVNFAPPHNGQQAHLAFEEVDVLFHEFGHVMHHSLTRARFGSQAGTNVSIDFVEAPSQMLENWVYRPEVLALISEDPKNPGHPLPDDLARRLGSARTFDAGIRYTRQVYLATFDQAIHTRGDHVDPDAVEHEVRGAITGYPLHAEEHSAASFGHLMGGYDSGYYGYLWSEVYADDMFSRFEKEGVLNPATGKSYRDIILAHGRELEPMELLKQFLGRDPNEEAFLRLTGIKAQ